MTTSAEKAERIIKEVREISAARPENDGAQPAGLEQPVHGDAFDFWVATNGWHEYGAFYLAAYTLANPRRPNAPLPATDEERAAAEHLRRERANQLWAEVRPYIRAYFEDCRAARYTGWSRMNDEPIRRVRTGAPGARGYGD